MSVSPPARFLLVFAAGTVVFAGFLLAFGEDVTWSDALVRGLLVGAVGATVNLLFERLGWTGSWRISKDPDDYR